MGRVWGLFWGGFWDGKSIKEGRKRGKTGKKGREEGKGRKIKQKCEKKGRGSKGPWFEDTRAGTGMVKGGLSLLRA